MENIGLNLIFPFWLNSVSEKIKPFFGLYFSTKLWKDFVSFAFLKSDLTSTGIIFPFSSITKSISAFDLVRQYFTLKPFFASSDAIKFSYRAPLSCLFLIGWKFFATIFLNPLSRKNILGAFTSSVLLLVKNGWLLIVTKVFSKMFIYFNSSE